MRRLATLALALLVAGSLAACGDDDTDTSAPADTTSDSPAPLGDDPSAVGDDAGSGGDDTPTGSFGTATVGDTT
jgi:hypothetical protein